MLDGLEATEVKLSDLDLSDRFDAEYASKENLRINEKLHKKPTRKIGELSTIAVSAFYPAATHLYAEGDVAFVRCVDCINHPVISRLQDESFERIPSAFLKQNSTIDTVGKGDLIITKVGSPCYTSIVHEHDTLALSRTVMGLKDIVGINPYYLLVFLRSHYGFSQLLRQRELTIQYQLTVERVKDVDVFTPTLGFQSSIESIVRAAHQKLEKSTALYTDAERLLLDEVRLRNWQPSNETVALKSFAESFGSTGRLDAEFYKPEYEALEKKLRRLGARTIGSSCFERPQRGVQPQFVEGGSVFVIASKAVRPSGVLLDETECTDELFYKSLSASKAVEERRCTAQWYRQRHFRQSFDL